MVTIKKLLKVILACFAFLLVLGVGVQLYLLRGTPGKPLMANRYRTDTVYSSVPTILIPGWGGNTITYNKLINYYQDHGFAQKVLTVWVSPWGTIRISGHLDKRQKNPLIQVLYDWNYDQTFHPQVKQLRKVLLYLQDHYHLHKVNVIAHSYGGTEFMHAYMNSPELQKKLHLKKVVFLGVPVEESLASRLHYQYHLIHHSRDKNFIRLREQMANWQPDYRLTIYNIMGRKKGYVHTDGEVPHIQSQMLRSLIKGHPMIDYQQRTYDNTTHSQLHDRQEILDYIADQLWKKEWADGTTQRTWTSNGHHLARTRWPANLPKTARIRTEAWNICFCRS